MIPQLSFCWISRVISTLPDECARFQFYSRRDIASVTPSLDFIVFGVGKHGADIDFLPVVVNRGNQTNPVPPVLNTVSYQLGRRLGNHPGL